LIELLRWIIFDEFIALSFITVAAYFLPENLNVDASDH